MYNSSNHKLQQTDKQQNVFPDNFDKKPKFHVENDQQLMKTIGF